GGGGGGGGGGWDRGGGGEGGGGGGGGRGVYRGQEYEDAEFRERPRERDSAAEEWDPRIDEILDKMSREGFHTLTEEEWEILARHRKRE
ncbi:MAG: hypothetical protein N2595_00005, partial [bacterium]|nr:hypothetical protein [bacterium]